MWIVFDSYTVVNTLISNYFDGQTEFKMVNVNRRGDFFCNFTKEYMTFDEYLLRLKVIYQYELNASRVKVFK